MKIAISGVTGFLGGHLARRLSAKGHQIIGLSRQVNPPKAVHQWMTYQQADITQTIVPIDCDIAIHCAGFVSDRGAYDVFYKANVVGTQHFYEACRSSRLFIQISSVSVYPLMDKIIKETDAKLAQCPSHYGKTNLLAEQYLQELNDQKPKIILRPRAIYGAGDRTILPRILNMVKGVKIVVPGDLRVNISMTSVHNLLNAIELAFSYQAPNTAIFNIADTEIYELRTVVQRLIQLGYGQDFPIRSLPPQLVKVIAKIANGIGIQLPFSSQSIDYVNHSSVLDLSAIQSELGYEAKTDLWQELDVIKAWVDRVGLDVVKVGGKELAWMA